MLGQIDLGGADLDMLAVQLTAALDGPRSHAARNRHEGTPGTRAGADDGRYGR